MGDQVTCTPFRPSHGPRPDGRATTTGRGEIVFLARGRPEVRWMDADAFEGDACDCPRCRQNAARGDDAPIVPQDILAGRVVHLVPSPARHPGQAAGSKE
jgi:hypothetical protein